MSHLRKDKGNEHDLIILAPQYLNRTTFLFSFSFFAAEVVFSEQLACVWEPQMKRSQHAVINPAINIILRSGSGGQGVPPLAGFDGKFILIILKEITKSKDLCLSRSLPWFYAALSPRLYAMAWTYSLSIYVIEPSIPCPTIESDLQVTRLWKIYTAFDIFLFLSSTTSDSSKQSISMCQPVFFLV